MWFAYLHWSWWQQTSLASKCIYNVSCQNERLFCATTTWSKCVVFICATSTSRSKLKQMLTVKKYVFLYEARLAYKSCNLLSAILLLSAKIICKWASIDVSHWCSLLAWGCAIRIVFSQMSMNKISGTKYDSLSSIYYKSERFTLTCTTRWDWITCKIGQFVTSDLEISLNYNINSLMACHDRTVKTSPG